MNDVSAALETYIKKEIALSRRDISASASSRDWFLTRIENVIAARQGEPVLYAVEPFVKFGSYFKGTKVADVDEFDILVVIDSNSGVFSSGGIAMGTGLGKANPNPKYYEKHKKLDKSGVSPSKMLNWLKGVAEEVTDAFGGEAPIRNGQAVTVKIESKDLRIDLVPAGVFERTTDGETFYNIPRGDADNGWILTSPRKDIELLDDIAEDKENFRNVIRILKRVRDTYNMKVSSFAIESMVVAYGQSKVWVGDLALDLDGALRSLVDAFRDGTIPDPFDAKVNLVDRVESLTWYATRLEGIADKLDEISGRDTMEVDDLYSEVWETLENE